MRLHNLVALAAAIVLPSFALAGDEALPADVRRFLAQRELCDQWGGEEPYDKARAAELERGAARDCRGTDRQLALLKGRYAKRPDVTARLVGLDTQVEPQPRRPRKLR